MSVTMSVKGPPPPTKPKSVKGRPKMLRSYSKQNAVEDTNLAFSLLDRNGDGELCKQDLRASMALLGNSDVTDKHIEEFLQQFSNRDKKIRKSDFQAWSEEQYPNGLDGEVYVLHEAFRVLDTDNDGYITMQDLKNGLHIAGLSFTDKMLKVMFQQATFESNGNSNGKMNFKDFQRTLMLS